MPFLEALLLGIVEGLTEFLPVSSTGHLILVDALLDRHDEASHAFEIVIQLGALAAVVVHYRALLAKRVAGLFRRDPLAIRLAIAVALGFAPAAVAGLLLHRLIEKKLFGPTPVAVALVVGGLVMIGVERLVASKAWRSRHLVDAIEDITPRQALTVGLGQCFSLWPGTSRSMATIVAGQLSGMTTRAAAEFSFLVALPTLGAATLYKAASAWRLLAASRLELGALGLGLVVSFVVALVVIAGFLRLLTRAGLTVFGVYRIVLGLAVFWLLRGLRGA